MKPGFSTAVPVTGLGVVSCLGTGVETFWRRVAAGETAIRDGLGRVEVRESDTGRALGFSLTAAREAMKQAGIMNWDLTTVSFSQRQPVRSTFGQKSSSIF